MSDLRKRIESAVYDAATMTAMIEDSVEIATQEILATITEAMTDTELVDRVERSVFNRATEQYGLPIETYGYDTISRGWKDIGVRRSIEVITTALAMLTEDNDERDS